MSAFSLAMKIKFNLQYCKMAILHLILSPKESFIILSVLSQPNWQKVIIMVFMHFSLNIFLLGTDSYVQLNWTEI